MILQMTCKDWSPRAMSAKFNFRVPTSWFLRIKSKKRSIYCLLVLMTKS